MGVAPGWNAAARAAGGDVLVFANDDVVPGPGSLERLVGALRERPDAGVVGPVGAMWDRAHVATHVDRRPGRSASRPCDAVSGFLFATRRETWEARRRLRRGLRARLLGGDRLQLRGAAARAALVRRRRRRRAARVGHLGPPAAVADRALGRPPRAPVVDPPAQPQALPAQVGRGVNRQGDRVDRHGPARAPAAARCAVVPPVRRRHGYDLHLHTEVRRPLAPGPVVEDPDPARPARALRAGRCGSTAT